MGNHEGETTEVEWATKYLSATLREDVGEPLVEAIREVGADIVAAIKEQTLQTRQFQGMSAEDRIKLAEVLLQGTSARLEK